MTRTIKINLQRPAFSCGLLLCSILLTLTPTVQAVPQNLTWDTTIAADGVITDGAGTWTTGAGNWNNGSTSVGINFATGDNVTFGTGAALAAAYTITLGGTGVTNGNMTFNYNGNANGYTIGATANSQAVGFNGGAITVSTTNNVVFNAIPTGNFSVTNTTTTIPRGIILVGNGTQTSANTITNCANTLLQAGNNSSTGTFGSANIVNNGTLAFRRSSTVTMGNAISGTGSVSYQLRGSTCSLNTAGTYSGATSFGPTGASAGSSTINWGVINALPTSTALTFNTASAASITADLKGLNQTLASLAGGDGTSDCILTSSLAGGTLTVSGTNAPTTYSGQLNGSLALVKSNTNSLTLNAANSYTGNTTINGGTLALGASSSIGSTPQISIGAGGTFDVSAIAAYALGTSTLAASGTTNAAIINGNSGGTIDFGSQAITLNFDGTNAPLTISQGQLLLNGNSFTVTRATPLAAGTYTLITNLSSTISSNGIFTVGGSAVSGTVAKLLVGGNTVKLQLVPVSVSTNNSTVVATPTTLPADNSAISTVTVTLKDTGNNPLVGVSVNWSVSGMGNTIIPAATGITDGSGHTSFTIQSIKAQTNLVTVTAGAVTLTNSLPIIFTNPSTPIVLTWDPAHTPSTPSDGAGTWDTSTANWANNSTDVAWPNNGNDFAVFGTGGALASSATVTLVTPVSVGGLNFNYTSVSSSQYTISGANTITLTNTPTINVVANALISSPLTGSGFVKDGAGVLRIDGNATNFSGGITVSNGLLQIGNNGGAGNLGTGTITLVDPGVLAFRRGAGGSITLSNLITGTTTGNVGFQLNQGSVVTLAKANTYTAATTILQPTGSGTAGTLKLGIDNGLPPTTAFSIYNSGASVQTFDLAGFNQTLGSLTTLAGGTTANSIVTNSSATPSTLTVSGTTTTNYSGALVGNIDLVKDGSGTLTVNTNNYSGSTTVKGGTLVLQQAALSTNSTVTVTNGTLQLDFGTVTNQVAAFILNGTNMPPGLYSAATESPYLAGTGSLLVVPVATINPNPPVLQVSVSGSSLSLAWPTNKGWILQSNSVSLTSTGAWFNYPADGSVTVTNVTVTVNPAKTNVFFRMLKP